MSTTAHTVLINGHPVTVPNKVIEAEGFYISFNDLDISVYGGVTTALVQGEAEHFYILYGDHRAGYMPLISQGFQACFDYFVQNISQISKYSEGRPK